jgi:hypothetical protein
VPTSRSCLYGLELLQFLTSPSLCIPLYHFIYVLLYSCIKKEKKSWLHTFCAWDFHNALIEGITMHYCLLKKNMDPILKYLRRVFENLNHKQDVVCLDKVKEDFWELRYIMIMLILHNLFLFMWNHKRVKKRNKLFNYNVLQGIL